MTVIGTGYLGATHAACMAELGHEVLGVDVDSAKIDSLSEGTVPFYEPGLPEVLTRNLESGRLDFTTDYQRAAEFANVHFLGVGTPQEREFYRTDDSWLLQQFKDGAEPPARWYLEVGTLEWLLDVNQSIAAELSARGAEHLLVLRNAGHNWTSWRNGQAQALRFVLGG